MHSHGGCLNSCGYMICEVKFIRVYPHPGVTYAVYILVLCDSHFMDWCGLVICIVMEDV